MRQLISSKTNSATDKLTRTVSAWTIRLLSEGPEDIENSACPRLPTIPSSIAMIRTFTAVSPHSLSFPFHPLRSLRLGETNFLLRARQSEISRKDRQDRQVGLGLHLQLLLRSAIATDAPASCSARCSLRIVITSIPIAAPIIVIKAIIRNASPPARRNAS
jgi:hypothetical protein